MSEGNQSQEYHHAAWLSHWGQGQGMLLVSVILSGELAGETG